MLGLTITPFTPDDDGKQILHLLSLGQTQQQIAGVLKITYTAMRQRILRLKLNLGAGTTEQMMFEYGRYTQKTGIK